MSERRAVLLLCWTTPAEAQNVAEHIHALETRSRHDVRTFNPVDRADAAAVLDLDEFDVVVVHYTIVATMDRYLPPVLREKIAAFRGLKVQFIQDEYRWIDAVTARLRKLGIDVLFTCVPKSELSKVYGDRVPGLRTIPTLPGYVSDELAGRQTPPIADRTIDVGYRGRTLPYWLGKLGHEKVEIGDGFAARAADYGLVCDISSAEGDRIYGDAWYRFIGSCKATLGTESGASIGDYDGAVEAAVKDYLVRRPDASFEEVHRALLEPHEGNVVINTVSSRIFEAAALRTAMILFEGDYSGALQPGTHYIPLERDFSNIGDVARRLRDLPFLEALTERTHADLVASGRYSLDRLVAQFDDIVDEAPARARAAKPAYERARRRSAASGRQVVSRLRRTAGRLAQPIAMGAVVAGDTDVRRLAARHRSGALFRDLWRIAALRRAVANGSILVESRLEEEGSRLVLTSRPPGTRVRARATPTAIRQGLERRNLTDLIWNHSLVGEAVGLVGNGLVSTIVGDHGVRGAYAFGPFLTAAREQPELGIAVLTPLLRAEPDADGRAPDSAETISDGTDREG